MIGKASGVAALLLTLTASAAGPARAAGPECPTPRLVTPFHRPAAFRQALEAFRLELEQERQALESRRSGLDPAEYRAGMADYLAGIDAYRDGIDASRRCPHAPNAVLSMTARPAPSRADNDTLSLTTRYYYTGDQGDAVSIGAITLLDGESTGHWGYRPSRITPGLHTAPVEVGMNAHGPAEYRSNGISVEMFVHRGAVFQRRQFPLDRVWRRGR